ncbi:hypothetical protein [Marinimicrobium sp. ABcell2]|uniref:hypothetical protein n=1 Tax=Marinimicrobium sp. ABcell2 TaxID=3069751 RepID=UPI0027B4EC9D|nr:hypothetical protein [Marinimicrobium sp. ABcell2]MDQ2076248.1 hypothetical protein [Marinimicrobium sp. ABcell2]
MKVFFPSLLALLLLLGCAAAPDTPVYVEGADQTYYQLNDRRFHRFVVPDRDAFAKYDKLLLFPLQLDGMLILRSTDQEINRSWGGSTYEDMLPYVSSFDELAAHLFAQGRTFDLTNTGGPNVLAVEFRLKSYRPHTPRLDAMGGGTVGDFTVTSFGDLRIEVVLADSQSGELVAVLEDAVRVSPRSFGMTAFGNTTTVDASARNTRGNQRAAWRRTFRHWLARFDADLNDLREEALKSAAIEI